MLARSNPLIFCLLVEFHEKFVHTENNLKTKLAYQARLKVIAAGKISFGTGSSSAEWCIALFFYA